MMRTHPLGILSPKLLVKEIMDTLLLTDITDFVVNYLKLIVLILLHATMMVTPLQFYYRQKIIKGK